MRWRGRGALCRLRVVGAQQRSHRHPSRSAGEGAPPLLFPRGSRGRVPASGTGPGCPEPRRRAARRRCGAAPGRECPEDAPLPAPGAAAGGDFAAGGHSPGSPLSSPLLASRRRSARRRLRNGRLWPPAAGSCHTAEAAAAGARSEPTLPPRMTHGEPALVSLVLAVDGEQPASSAGRGQGKRIAHPKLRRPQGRAPDPGIPRGRPAGGIPQGAARPLRRSRVWGRVGGRLEGEHLAQRLGLRFCRAPAFPPSEGDTVTGTQQGALLFR